MLAWYRVDWVDPSLPNGRSIVCCRDHWNDRREFLECLARWFYPGRRYRDIPERCIKKLFPNVQWEHGMDMDWPLKENR